MEAPRLLPRGRLRGVLEQVFRLRDDLVPVVGGVTGGLLVPGAHDADGGATCGDPGFELRGGVVDEHVACEDGFVGEVNDVVAGGVGVLFEPEGAFVRPRGASVVGGGDEDDASELAQALNARDGVGVGGERPSESWFGQDVLGDGPEVAEGFAQVEGADVFRVELLAGPVVDFVEQGANEVSDDTVDVEADERLIAGVIHGGLGSGRDSLLADRNTVSQS